MRLTVSASAAANACSILPTSFPACARKRSVTAAANFASPPQRFRTAAVSIGGLVVACTAMGFTSTGLCAAGTDDDSIVPGLDCGKGISGE